MHNCHLLLLLVIALFLLLQLSCASAQTTQPAQGAPPHVALDPDGTLKIDGQRTFVYGAYRDPSDDYRVFDGVRQAGFNMTHSYDFEQRWKPTTDEYMTELIAKARQYLAGAHKAGVGTFMGIPRVIVGQGDLAALEQYVVALRDEPALWLWYLFDEPDNQEKEEWVVGPLHEHMKNCYELIKRLDPQHPVCYVGARMNSFARFGDTCDLMWVEVYSAPRNILDAYVFPARALRDQPTKPAWLVLGNLSNVVLKAGNNPVVVRDELYRPNPKEIRALAHTAIAGKAQGVVFYWLPWDRFDLRAQAPTAWQAMVDLGAEFKALSKVLVSQDPVPPVTVEAIYQKRNTLGSSSWVTDKGSDYSRVVSWTRMYEGDLYLGLINAGYDTQVKVTVTLPGSFSRVLQYPTGEPIISKQDDSWEIRHQRIPVTIFDIPNDKTVTLIMHECDAVVWRFNIEGADEPQAQ